HERGARGQRPCRRDVSRAPRRRGRGRLDHHPRVARRADHQRALRIDRHPRGGHDLMADDLMADDAVTTRAISDFALDTTPKNLATVTAEAWSRIKSGDLGSIPAILA